MTRATFRRCRACGEYHWTDNWPANHVEPIPERSSVAAPMLIRDGLDDLWHPHDGKRYDSKSAFRATTKAAGSEEIGNEVQARATPRPDASIKDDVGKAMQMLNQGYRPKDHGTASSEGWT